MDWFATHLGWPMCSWYLGVGLQVVVEYIDTDGEVTGIVGVGAVPALRTELPALHYHSVEVD